MVASRVLCLEIGGQGVREVRGLRVRWGPCHVWLPCVSEGSTIGAARHWRAGLGQESQLRGGVLPRVNSRAGSSRGGGAQAWMVLACLTWRRPTCRPVCYGAAERGVPGEGGAQQCSVSYPATCSIRLRLPGGGRELFGLGRPGV